MNALIVDDQPSTLMLMRAILDRAGYSVAECSTGEIAISALTANDYDLLVLDLNLPDMSGLDVLHSPRLDRARMPPVLGITGSLTPELVERAEAAGVRCVLEKPISSEQLLEQAEAAIGARARPPESVVRSGPAIDSSILAEIGAIGDEELILRFVNQALADAWHSLDELAGVAASGDIDAWRQCAQTLNGVVRTLGARRVAVAITEALSLPPAQLRRIANALTTQFINLLDEAQESLREWLAHTANGLLVNPIDRESLPRLVDEDISERERDVLRWTAAGKTSAEIGTILGISTRTVNFHITSLLLKLNAVNKTHAVVKAMMLDLLK